MSIGRRTLLRSGPIAALMASSGCSLPSANYYRLAVISGTIQNTTRITIGVRRINIPGYLDQTGIAKPTGNDEFATYANDLWAEPLAEMLQAVMAQDLAQRLPRATVLSSDGAIGAPNDALVEINLLKFDFDTNGDLVLIVQISIKSGLRGTVWVTQTFQSSAVAGANPAGSVPVMSRLWGNAADRVAAMVVKSAIGISA